MVCQFLNLLSGDRFTGQPLDGLVGKKFSHYHTVVPVKGDKDDAVQIILLFDDLNDLLQFLSGKRILQLQNAHFIVLLTDVDIFGQQGNADVFSGGTAVQIRKDDILQNIIGHFLNIYVYRITGYTLCGLIVDHHVFAVGGSVDIGLNTEITSVAGSHKSHVGVLSLKSAHTTVSNHFHMLSVNLNCIITHNYLLLASLPFPESHAL